MKAAARMACLLTAAALATAPLAGCKPPADVDDEQWVYDFMADGDAVLDSSSGWYVDGGYTGPAPEGWWMGNTGIAAPYLFTGDFTAEFEFYLKYYSTEDDIFRFAFNFIDPNWDTSSEKYCYLAAYYTKLPVPHGSAYYQLTKGIPYVPGDHSGNVPGIASGVNTCTMERSGTTVVVTMNGTPVGTISIDAGYEPYVGYAPMIQGHNSADEAATNFYIRKLTVTYEPGEVVEHDWNE